ncbi:uncharacterized protein LOC141682732 [Apium graveolens]|uniref:uncharacterized protein LOC141682732 n=1 Tax=Apium graveolens TaxID=4045 RepID=UPI003D79D93A
MVLMVTFFTQLTTYVTLSQVPLISSLVSSWLQPLYLYLIINFIIITIFISSKLQQHHGHSKPIKKFPSENNYDREEQSKLADVMQLESLTEIEGMEVSNELYENGNHCVPTLKPKTTVLANNLQLDYSNNANISYSDDGTKESAYFEPWKFQGSARFVHPKVVEANTQGKKKLGVPKPEQELETLESTWKAITDGRPMPITHQHTGGGNLQNSHKMITSETFSRQQGTNRNNISRTLAGSPSSGKLKRDPSPGQDELNKRVEAFISRFKEDMRLQRKESLRQYVEMINSSAY